MRIRRRPQGQATLLLPTSEPLADPEPNASEKEMNELKEGDRAEGLSAAAQRQEAAADDNSKRQGNGKRKAETIKAGKRPVRSVPARKAAAAAENAKEEAGSSSSHGGKKRRRRAVLKDGVRCSRRNGRGWRCSQKPVDGKSLCEHHSGQGKKQNKGELGRTEPGRETAAAPPPSAGDS